jgi:predicted negative regulator of RcsB-dependent stress response
MKQTTEGTQPKKAGRGLSRFWRKNGKKTVLAVVPVLIIGVGIIVAAIIIRQNSTPPAAEEVGMTPGIIGENQGDLIDRAYRQADDLQAQGKYEEGKKILVEALQGKNGILLTKGQGYMATVAINQGAWDDALAYAQKYEAADHSVTSADLLAQAHTGKGDKSEAIASYQKAMTRMKTLGFDADDENKQAQYKGYENNIKELQQ